MAVGVRSQRPKNRSACPAGRVGVLHPTRGPCAERGEPPPDRTRLRSMVDSRSACRHPRSAARRVYPPRASRVGAMAVEKCPDLAVSSRGAVATVRRPEGRRLPTAAATRAPRRAGHAPAVHRRRQGTWRSCWRSPSAKHGSTVRWGSAWSTPPPRDLLGGSGGDPPRAASRKPSS